MISTTVARPRTRHLGSSVRSKRFQLQQLHGRRERPLHHHQQQQRRCLVEARSSKQGSGGFWSGVLVGGTVFGVLGFLFAPQVSRALLNSERMKKLLGEGNENLEVTRDMLNDKISELNSAIDGVSQQLQSRTANKESQVESL
ncbi:hypothetical protein HOP50_18g81790 [Chloropicon primus]|nr:hypothetical protein A3770_18p81550 [Chloropicon primus]UPR04834.1 hypothetical protein HOP50_18g81790 [Chloropicon primus]|mmetsp:Transcript_5638/g.17121  ORF Transcript_5638/g.17121 Transcript_5638/m.17121 type:complete len:143 (+) Transcript_5638:94-522(+)|eukprot:QDZ25637.1 hypothetical protein A3770_18p81550 [Chloropicon primus]